MDRAASRPSTGTAAPGSSATGPKFSFTGGVFSYEKGVARRRVVRLVALRRPRLPVPEAVGRRRLRRPRRHPDHLRRDPPRVLDPDRPPGRHGRQPRRGLDLLPQHAPPLLRADVLRAGRQARTGPELALLCVQAYNDWMIDEWCAGDGQGPAHPAHHRAAVGRRAGRRRGAPLRRQGQPRRRLLREPAPARPAVDPLRRTGTRSSRRARRPRPSCACTSARRRGCRPRRPTRRSSCQLDAHVPERHGLDARLHLLGHARAVPRR